MKTETTGIGSLPFTNAAEAAAHVFTSYSIPFLPQLVQHPTYKSSAAPQMLQEVIPADILGTLLSGTSAHPDALRQLWRQNLQKHVDSLPAVPEFKSRLKSFSGRYYKLQLCGPLTAARIIEHRTKQNLTPTVREVLTEMITATATTLIRSMQKVSEVPCMFIWDEGIPFTEPSGVHEKILAHLLQVTEGQGATPGVHCCAPFHPSVFRPHGKGRWLAADLTTMDMSDPSVIAALSSIHDQGGLIAGVADTRADTVDRELMSKVVRNLADITDDGNSSFPVIYSGGCGTGLKDAAFERDLASALSAVL